MDVAKRRMAAVTHAKSAKVFGLLVSSKPGQRKLELAEEYASRLNEAGKNDTPNEYLLLDAYQNPASPEMIQKLFNYGRYLLISS